MGKKVGAILLDTRSIQRYVFSCNKLKTNVGASYLVDAIFNDLMQKVVLPEFERTENLKISKIPWQETEKIQMQEKNSEDECEIVYIGGGNMLILVNKYPDNMEKNLELCREIVGCWSREMICKTPGLKTGAAIGEMDIDDFKNSLDNMYKQLKANQNTVLPQVDLPYTGLTLECDVSGKTADVFDWTDKRWISNEVKSKTDAYKFAADKVRAEYENELNCNGVEYDFVNDLEHIGCKDGESYVSIIHIDGNNMGVKFGNCRTSQERKKLSLKVAGIVQTSFKKLLQSIIKDYNSGIYEKVLDMQDLKQNDKKLLPIRPIIIGGDDITFICPARLGIEYAKRFIEAVNEEELLTIEQHDFMEEASGKKINEKMSCCGGVAIVPLKYPFFRAYQLAESLCGSAKNKSRKDDNSLIDFAILYGEMTPTLDQLCRYQYNGAKGYLHYGPYSIINKTEDKSHIDDLLSLKDKLADRVPENKIKELRDVLTKDLHSMTRFLENCKQVEVIVKAEAIVKEETGNKKISAEDFWQKKKDETESKTRYIDAIEIMDFTLPKTEG